ncbi:hypothetical protein J7H87_004335 [Vibrio parahaemolyticus]|nr:hypothetical protein [Vibrio parahaemolyticus]EHK0063524.1 hypothetical protein [Vibrio parahaemolyticus]
MIFNCSHFPSSFEHLNGSHELEVSRLRLARCVMTVGCINWRGAKARGVYRLIHLASLVYSNVESYGPSLKLHQDFFKLDQSEKVPISYHLGSGLTKLFAEEYLNIPWLGHVSSFKSVVSWTGSAVPSKVVLYKPKNKKNASEPDLIGYDRSRTPHILEAKGYSSGFSGSVLQHAIDQVSQVSNVAGKTPLTKVACFNDLAKSPFESIIVDPVVDGNEGCSINVPLHTLIESYYRLFRGEEFSKISKNYIVGDREYKVAFLKEANIWFGVDLELLKASENIYTFNLVYDELYGKAEREVLGDGIDFGMDGIFVADERSFGSLSSVRKI